MKKNIIYIVVLLAVGVLVWFVFLKPEGDTIGKGEAAFTIKDTAEVQKIFLIKSAGERVKLERKDDYWVADGKYRVAQPQISYFLTTLYRQVAEYPVPEAKHNSVVTIMAGNNIKAEIYMEGQEKPIVFYVGDESFNFSGTYMLMEGAKRPYVVNIPGFDGSLYSRYATDLKTWRDRTVFAIPAENITKVSVQYPTDPAESFIITRNGEQVSVDVDTQIDKSKLNQKRVNDYLGFFDRVYCEGFMNNAYEIGKVIAGVPRRCTIDVTGKDGYAQHVTVYWLPINKHSKNVSSYNDSNYYNTNFDADHFYAVFNNNADTAIIQSLSFEKFFQGGVTFFEGDK